jgi:hypothetical protein
MAKRKIEPTPERFQSEQSRDAAMPAYRYQYDPGMGQSVSPPKPENPDNQQGSANYFQGSVYGHR